MLFHNKLPNTLWLKTTQAYCLTDSMGQEFRLSFISLSASASHQTPIMELARLCSQLDCWPKKNSLSKIPQVWGRFYFLVVVTESLSFLLTVSRRPPPAAKGCPVPSQVAVFIGSSQHGSLLLQGQPESKVNQLARGLLYHVCIHESELPSPLPWSVGKKQETGAAALKGGG